MDNPARKTWHDLLGSWRVDSCRADQSFDDVARHYASPGRHYHTLAHVMQVLGTAESISCHATSMDAVRLAAWLHDVIYESKASDNEERSAQYAERLCEDLSIPEGRPVASLIGKTKTHDSGDDANAQVLLDADLAILGASESAYQDYAARIRMEYDWVPIAEYRKRRRQILQSFLDRPRIYHLVHQLEEPARRNLIAEIRELTL
jgi:predicted metal-dependent HD superfamily phosphohydrolase